MLYIYVCIRVNIFIDLFIDLFILYIYICISIHTWRVSPKCASPVWRVLHVQPSFVRPCGVGYVSKISLQSLAGWDECDDFHTKNECKFECTCMRLGL